MSDAPLAVTPGEPAGVGVDLALGLWAARTVQTPPFFLIDDPDRVAARARLLGIAAELAPLDDPSDAVAAFSGALPVLGHAFPADSIPGRPDPANGPATVDAITRAVALVRNGQASAVVTNPIQKETLYQAGMQHPGHTELLADLSGADGPPVMMLAVEGLRVVPATIHMPLADVPAALSTDLLVTQARIIVSALRRDFGIPAPRLAVTGLNPHAGEGGSLGREDREIIAPAVRQLVQEGIAATGPHPADTLFHEAARRRYDVALCMYHDQALIPVKMLDFWEGVNITLGLPIVRTSPDHGTALDLAGTGKADARSLAAALRAAASIAAARRAARTAS